MAVTVVVSMSMTMVTIRFTAMVRSMVTTIAITMSTMMDIMMATIMIRTMIITTISNYATMIIATYPSAVLIQTARFTANKEGTRKDEGGASLWID